MFTDTPQVLQVFFDYGLYPAGAILRCLFGRIVERV